MSLNQIVCLIFGPEGEFLSRLPFPKQTFATESYVPNVNIAKNRLEPLGITVKQITSDSDLPFDDEIFTLLLIDMNPMM